MSFYKDYLIDEEKFLRQRFQDDHVKMRVLQLRKKAYSLYFVKYRLDLVTAIHPPYWALFNVMSECPNRGNATKAMTEVVEFAKEHKLFIKLTAINERAERIYLRAGFTVQHRLEYGCHMSFNFGVTNLEALIAGIDENNRHLEFA